MPTACQTLGSCFTDTNSGKPHDSPKKLDPLLSPFQRCGHCGNSPQATEDLGAQPVRLATCRAFPTPPTGPAVGGRPPPSTAVCCEVRAESSGKGLGSLGGEPARDAPSPLPSRPRHPCRSPSCSRRRRESTVALDFPAGIKGTAVSRPTSQASWGSASSGFRSTRTWVPVAAPPLTSCVTLGASLPGSGLLLALVAVAWLVPLHSRLPPQDAQSSGPASPPSLLLEQQPAALPLAALSRFLLKPMEAPSQTPSRSWTPHGEDPFPGH